MLTKKKRHIYLTKNKERHIYIIDKKMIIDQNLTPKKRGIYRFKSKSKFGPKKIVLKIRQNLKPQMIFPLFLKVGN